MSNLVIGLLVALVIVQQLVVVALVWLHVRKALPTASAKTVTVAPEKPVAFFHGVHGTAPGKVK